MKIEIKGFIVPDDYLEVYQWLGYTATSPKVIKNAVAEAEKAGEKEILIEINSGGGSVWAGAEMYYALKKFNGTVKGEIPSIAASAATFPAMACDHLGMSILGHMMIHRAKNGLDGHQQDMRDNADFLKNIDDSIVSAYLTKTSLSREELNEMMKKDSWMTAQQALENKFIDEILFINEAPNAIASATDLLDNSSLLPQDVIDKIKAEILASKTIDPINVAIQNNSNSENANKEESKSMDLNQLKNEHPDLVEQIKNEAKNEAIAVERKRIQEIENIAQPGTEEIVNKAKFETGVSAAETAMEILKAQNEQKQTQMQNRITDAASLNQIDAADAPPNKNDAQELENILNNLYGNGGK